MASEVAATAASAARRAAKEFTGVVVSAGKMDKTFKIKLGGMRYEPRVQKVRQSYGKKILKIQSIPPTFTYLRLHTHDTFFFP